MRTLHRVILAFWLLGIAAMGVFPPWTLTLPERPRGAIPIGYHLLLTGPALNAAELADVGRRVKFIYPRAYDDLTDEDLGRGIAGKYPARITYERLMLQALIATAFFAAIFVLVPSRRKSGGDTREEGTPASLAPRDWAATPEAGTHTITATGGELPENIQRAVDAGADPSKSFIRPKQGDDTVKEEK